MGAEPELQPGDGYDGQQFLKARDLRGTDLSTSPTYCSVPQLSPVRGGLDAGVLRGKEPDSRRFRNWSRIIGQRSVRACVMTRRSW